jgi:hypothetical protein
MLRMTTVVAYARGDNGKALGTTTVKGDAAAEPWEGSFAMLRMTTVVCTLGMTTVMRSG